MVVGAHEMIRRCFGGRVRAARVVGGAFFEQAGVAEAAVYFVGRHMMEHMVGFFAPSSARGLQKLYGAHNVGQDKFHWPLNGAVYVAFCCQVNDVRNLVVGKNALQSGCVADIGALKAVVGGAFDVFEVFEVARVGQFVKIDNQVVGVVLDQASDDMRTDKSCSAGNKYVFRKDHLYHKV